MAAVGAFYLLKGATRSSLGKMFLKVGVIVG